MKTSFTTTDIVKGLKIPFGRLREWIVRGYIKPSVPAAGPGRPAEFTINDVYSVQLFAVMMDGGFTRESAASHLGYQQTTQWGQCELFFFRRSRGEKVTLFRVVYTQDFDSDESQVSVDIKTGRLFIPKPRPEYQQFDDLINLVGGWTDIYIVNVRQIREEVDEKMKGL